MRHIFAKELKLNMKSFIIWSLSVGLLGLACILLYKSMQGDMKEMADAFSNMGAFSDAFGMSTLSIATLKGYFATEVGTVHGLGGGMFAAIMAISIISKEEEGHSGEFIYSLPVSRSKVLLAKGLCVAVYLVAFTIICGLLYAGGFVALDEELPTGQLLTFMVRQMIMNFELAGICFGISSISWKNRMGLGIALSMCFYFYDVIGRVVPDLKDYLFVGPYSYANAAEIFTDADTPVKALVIAAVMIVCSVAFAFWYYNKRDLAS
ncbi:MAG: ABC transporter permease subunit [Lachnospiraceae bacterium]|nr:ABC transporter permease subunit [Lachnospiraceae bacterium]